MERDKKLLQKKAPAQKTTPDGMEERSENIGDMKREEFNLRTERQDIALGRSPRDSPDSVRGTISRHKKQARQFTEHAAKPVDERQPETGRGASTTTEARAGGASSAEQPGSLPPHFVTPSHTSETDRLIDTAGTAEQPQAQEALPDSKPAARETTLSHEHAPRSMPERPGRLRHGGSTTTASKESHKKPTSPDAAKYTPPGEAEKHQQFIPSAMDDMKPTPESVRGEPEKQTPARDSGTDRNTPEADRGVERNKPYKPGKLKFGGSETAPTTVVTPPDDKTPGIPKDDAPSVSEETPQAEESHEKPRREYDTRAPKPDGGNSSPRSKHIKPGKLKFSGDEAAPATVPAAPDKKPPGRKLAKARQKAEHSAAKLDKAQKHQPKKHSIQRVKVTDEKSGAVKKKLRFETEVKSQGEHLKGPLITRPVKLGANAAVINTHRKLYQVEHENVGTQAAHKGEMIAEGGLRLLYRKHKTAPYRKVEKLASRTTKLNIKASYQQALNDNPKLRNNLFSRMVQKRKIKKDYAKAAREAKKTAQNVKKTGDVIGRAGQAVVKVVTSHPAVFGIIGGLFLIVVIISSLFTSCSNMATGVGSAIAAVTYLAEDAAADDAELYYTEWETDLLMQIGRTETDRGGYDEYRYNVGNIGHNPYELMAFLTAVYQDFNYADVEAVLRQIFAEQYQLTFTPSIETRYTDPEDADGDGDYGAYDWNVLTVTLTSRSFTDVIYSRMDSDQLKHYGLLMRSKGNRQYAGSPFDFNWLPYVTSNYGYRVHPTTGAKDYHLGIDIGVPIGTDIHAAHDGTVTTGYDAGGYGYYVTITGADGLVTKYAHCDSLLVSNGQAVIAGDIIAKSGNSGNSTGPHLHFEVIKNGRHINPIYFSQTNDTGAGPVYGDPGAPMGDGSYAALIEEAERHLGRPYVWGGSSPSTSFDCSGYVSWCINQSGVGSVGRQTAQGLYNLCTPISPSEAQPGDLIFFTGTYSASVPVTHIGIYVGGGQMIHCGDPIQYASINSSYWQSHFYSFGRLN